MPTDVEIASQALVLIGDEPITSFTTSPGAGAEAGKELYEDTYLAVMSEHPWSFGLKEADLVLNVFDPDQFTNFKYSYDIPGDMIRLWAVMPQSEYTIVGPLLYSNETDLLARYVYDVGEAALPPHFVKALMYKLSSEFAIAVTESVSMAELYEKKYHMALAQARNIDSQSKPQVPIIDSPFVDVRLSGRGFFYG